MLKCDTRLGLVTKTYLITSKLKRLYTSLSQLIKKESNKKTPLKGHKIFTNVSTVFKNKRRKGCSSVHVEIVQDEDDCYSEARCLEHM